MAKTGKQSGVKILVIILILLNEIKKGAKNT